jgi:hypothetical protein
MYAYLFGELTKIGIDGAGESQLVGFPTQFPSVSMLDWNDGRPNARFWALTLLHDNFGPGDKLFEAESSPSQPYVYTLAFVSHDGKRRVLLINKRNRTFDVSAFHPPASAKLGSDTLKLGGFSVTVVTLP